MRALAPLLVCALLLMGAAPDSVVTPTTTTTTTATTTTTPATTTTTTTPATTTKKARGEARDLFQGFLVAQNATETYAPEFVFRVAGWHSDWGQRKLVELAPDGKQVKQGDVVARFEFGAEDALRRVKERIARAQSDANQSTIAGGQTLESLEIASRRKQIDARMASLSLEKARALSRVQAEGLRIQQQLAEFDVAAAVEQLASARTSQAAERAHSQQTLAAAQEMMQRYDFYVGRFSVKAPHDGVVRHAFNARERRKLQKGDNVQSGMRVLSLAKDDALAVRFFVPEAQAPVVKIGSRVAIQIPTTAEEREAVVVAVDFFPQELGFLLENEALPNGREKAIQVRATLSTSTAGLAAGTEVRVKLLEDANP